MTINLGVFTSAMPETAPPVPAAINTDGAGESGSFGEMLGIAHSELQAAAIPKADVQLIMCVEQTEVLTAENAVLLTVVPAKTDELIAPAEFTEAPEFTAKPVQKAAEEDRPQEQREQEEHKIAEFCDPGVLAIPAPEMFKPLKTGGKPDETQAADTTHRVAAQSPASPTGALEITVKDEAPATPAIYEPAESVQIETETAKAPELTPNTEAVKVLLPKALVHQAGQIEVITPTPDPADRTVIHENFELFINYYIDDEGRLVSDVEMLNITAKADELGLKKGDIIMDENGKLIAFVMQKDDEFYLVWKEVYGKSPLVQTDASIQYQHQPQETQAQTDIQKAFEGMFKAHLSVKTESKELNELLEKAGTGEHEQKPPQIPNLKPVFAGAPQIIMSAPDTEKAFFPPNQIHKLADEILARLTTAKDGTSTFEMTLNPESLGRITVKLVLKAGGVSAEITAEKASTALMLQNSADRIGAALDKADARLEYFIVEHKADYSEPREDNSEGGRRQYESEPEQNEEPFSEDGISFADLLGA